MGQNQKYARNVVAGSHVGRIVDGHRPLVTREQNTVGLLAPPQQIRVGRLMIRSIRGTNGHDIQTWMRRAQRKQKPVGNVLVQ